MVVVVIHKAFRNNYMELVSTRADVQVAPAPLACYKAPHQAVALANWIILTRQQSKTAQRASAFATSRLGRLALAA